MANGLWNSERMRQLRDLWERVVRDPLIAGPPPVAPRDDEELIRRLNPVRPTVEGPTLHLPGEEQGVLQPGLDLRTPLVPPPYDMRWRAPATPRQGYYPSNEDLILTTEAERRVRRRRA